MDTTETHGSAVDRAYEWLRDELLSRRIAANDLVTEGQIADAVGVSRTPVREALLRLQAEGFVRLLPKRGALVLPVTADETADVIEARRLIETYAVRRAVATNDAALVSELRRHIDTMSSAARQPDRRAYVEADRAFHAAIVAATGNDILKSLYRSLRDRQLRMGVVSLADDGPAERGGAGRMRSALAEHQAILAAVEARTVRGAEAAVQAHLDTNAQALLPQRRRA